MALTSNNPSLDATPNQTIRDFCSAISEFATSRNIKPELLAKRSHPAVSLIKYALNDIKHLS